MEVEIKFKISEPEEFEKRILDMGAEFLNEVYEEDIYFNHPCWDFKERDEALRIRNDGTLTFKGPKVDSDTKSREEYTVSIGNIEMARKILEKVGFKKAGVVRKRRKYYKFRNSEITIDFVENLGTFVEIECLGDYKTCRKEVMEIKKSLNLGESIRYSYLEMLYNTGST